MTAILLYAFRTTAPNDPYMIENGDPASFTPFTEPQKNLIRADAAELQKLIDVVLIENTTLPSIEFDTYDITSGVGAFTDGHYVHGDNNPTPPNQIFTHELGHTLGLPHSTLPQNETIMSAFAFGPFQDFFRAADIWHLTQIWGAATETFASNETYVDALYRDILGREGDAGGVAAQVAALVGGVSRVTLMGNFVHSAEYLATHDYFA